MAKEESDETETILVCKICGKPVSETHIDDAQTKWYKCENDHHTSRPKKQELHWPVLLIRNLVDGMNSPEYAKFKKQLDRQITDEEVIQILGKTVKHDNVNKMATLLLAINTYSEQDQSNLAFLACSSTGKSYIPLEIIKFFPEEDLIVLGYCSPTAFFHEWGDMLPDPADKREVETKKKRKIIYVDLEQKLLVFLDQPHSKLLENLRPLLSHDKKEISLKISDRSEKSGLRTKTVVIRGYPTVIFCSAKMNLDEQEKTRLLLLSPEVNQEKIREAIILKIEKEGNTENYEIQLKKDKGRGFLANRIYQIKEANILEVEIPEELRSQIYLEFMEQHKFLQPRNMRDINKLMGLIKGFTRLNFQHRERRPSIDESGEIATATREDVMLGFKYYGEICIANELGIPPETYETYQIFEKEMSDEGLTRKDICKIYYEKYHKFLGKNKFKQIVDTLESSGLWTEIPDPADRRVIRYISQGVGVIPESNDNNLEFNDNSLLKYDLRTPTPEGI